MSEILGPLFQGSALILDPALWILCIIGVFVGAIVGALPGVGLTLAYGLSLPFTFLMDPVYAVAYLLSLSVGAQYGNSIPAIIMGLPGSPASVLTVADGYALHRQGKTGLALAVQLVAAIFGQFVSIFFFVALVVPLAGLAYLFLSPELFALYVLGMTAIISLTGKSILKGMISATIGIGIGLIGLDPIEAVPRFDFGIRELRVGLETAPVLIGLLAVSELFRQARQTFNWSGATLGKVKFPPLRELRGLLPQMLGGTIIGTLIGAIPGAGTTPATLISYQQAQLWSKHPEKFGRGSTEGIAANEAAQNASNAGELIPTMGLGIPASGSTTLLLTALVVQGFIPGPRLIQDNPELVSAAVGGMFVGTLLLIIFGWWMCKAVLRAIGINRSAVIVVSLALVVLGVYSLQFRTFDVIVSLVFGVIGYFMLRYGFAPAAATLAAILAADFERRLRQGLSLVDDNVLAFVTRPITAVTLLVALGLLIYGARSRRKLMRMDFAAATAAGSLVDGGVVTAEMETAPALEGERVVLEELEAAIAPHPPLGDATDDATDAPVDDDPAPPGDRPRDSEQERR